ncbi:MAG: hypothetical protein KatS3mg057_2261 [Herpetosiphonaceae bacterium]|nr:MAG: hypothetical protein KatS3mg057_2261 [Herpetosiphonaceae bacterium]
MNLRRRWRSSISAKIIFVVWTVSLLPLLFLGLYGSLTLQSGHAEIAAQEYAAMKRLAVQQAEETTTLRVRDLDHQLGEVKRILELLRRELEAVYALPPPSDLPVELQRDPRYGFHWSHAGADGPTYWLTAAYTFSAELDDDLRRSGRIESLLRQIYEVEQGRFANIYLNTASGLGVIYPQVDVPAMVELGLLPADLSFPEVSFYALADPAHNPSREITWTPPYLDPVGKGWMVTAMAPVYAPNGTFEGVLGADLTLQTLLNDLLAPSLTYRQQYTLLLDADGLVVAAPENRRAELGWPSSAAPGEFNLGRSERSAWQEVLAPLLDGNIRHAEIDLPEGRRYLFNGWVEATGWHVVTVLPEEDIIGPLQPMRESNLQTLRAIGQNVLLAALLALAIAPLIGIALSRQITRPLRSFTQQVSALAAGTGPLQPVSVSGQDEVGRLARAFNRMVDELNARTRQIEEQQKILQERNAELTALNAVISSLHSSLNLSDVYKTALQQSLQFLGCEYGMIYLLDGDKLQIERAILPEDVAQHVQPVAERGLSGEVLRLRAPVISTDLSQDSRIRVAPEHRGNLRAYLGVPLQHAGMLYGVLAVLTESERVFSPREIALMQAIGEQVGMAIANAQLYADLQRSYAKLAAAQEEATRAQRLRAIGQLASGIAHDFNNMLTGIMGFTNLLMLDETDPERRHMLAAIERTVGDGAALVARMQEFGRVRRDQPRSPVNLNAIVEEAVELTRPRWRDTAQASGVPITLNLDLAPLPLIPGDPAGLREMLTNLILNALDAMPDGGTLRIVTEQQAEVVLLHMSDTGVGIAPEVRDRIFEPFFTTKGIQGHGLGLAMVKAIISHHGGKIDVMSSPNSGTTFTIQLPLRSGEIESVEEIRTVEQPGLRLLVIEDDPVVRSGLVELLRRWGHDVTAAADGEAGIAAFVPGNVDVVITDLGMPKISGWDVIKAVRDVDPAVRIILLTGWGNQIQLEAVLEAGANALLSKPYAPERLRALLAELTINKLNMLS